MNQPTDRTASGIPLFSIILPTRDRPHLLREAVDSVKAQTVRDWELVVVDDASTPMAVIPCDPRIQLVRLTTQRGPGGARNAGVAVARGHYVAFLDDDDLFTEDRLEMVISALDRAPIVACGTRFVGLPERSNQLLHGYVGDSILDGGPPCLGATTIDRTHFVPFDECWLGVEDVDWWLRIAATTPITTVSSVGYLVRRRARSEPDRLPRRVRENYALLEAHGNYFRSHPRARAFRLKRIGLMSLAIGDRAGARRAFAWSLRARPSVRNTWHLARSCFPWRSG